MMKPKVLGWFKAYCGILTVMYLLLIPLGILYMVIDPGVMQKDAMEMKIMGIIFIVMGLPLSVGSALPFFLKPAPWVWIYGIVVICLGMTSCCFLPICIPLLVYWIKPETKAYFGR